jgi:hypothetical protein
MARPKGTGKPPGEKYVIKTFSCPPDLWDEVQEFIPLNDRSALIQGCLRREVAKRRRERGKAPESGESEDAS